MDKRGTFVTLVALSLIATMMNNVVGVTKLELDGRGLPVAERARSKPLPTSDLDSYRGLASWIDIYNAKPWRSPEQAVRRMKARGVRTLFLETANYGLDRPLFRPNAIARFIVAAHAQGLHIVAWYVPSFANMKLDLKRSRAALGFTTADGQRFDSFALDIESTRVGDIELRNQRLLKLSRILRADAGTAALGAIIPDPVGSTYWPSFPYRAVARLYDVILPMSYYTYRASGEAAVYRYIAAGIHKIRSASGRPGIRVHPIGGIADAGTTSEVRGYVRAARRNGAIGGSLYDFPITREHHWSVLAPLNRLGR